MAMHSSILLPGKSREQSSLTGAAHGVAKSRGHDLAAEQLPSSCK